MPNLMAAISPLLRSQRSLEWRPQNPDTFHRYVDASEAFQILYGSHNTPSGRRRADIAMSIKIRMTTDEQVDLNSARAAWVALRRRHPTLASTVSGSERVYNRGDKWEIDRWLEETFVHVSQHEAMTPGLLEAYEATPRPTIYFLENSQTFAIRSPHYTMDARGLIYLLNDFVAELSKSDLPKHPDADENPTDLSPCLQVALEAPAIPSPSQLLDAWRSYQKWKRSFPSVGIIPTSLNNEPGKSTWQDLRYSTSTTKDLIARAEEMGLSWTHVIHAALILGAKNHGKLPDGSNYSGFILLDMRPRCRNSASYNDVVSLRCAFWPLTVPATDFSDTAAEVKRQYVAAIDNKGVSSLAKFTCWESMRSLSTSYNRIHGAPLVTGLGSIDHLLSLSQGPVVVESFSVSREVTHHDITVVVWSFRGELTIRVMYNDAFHSSGNIKRYLDLTDKALSDGLSLTLEIMSLSD